MNLTRETPEYIVKMKFEKFPEEITVIIFEYVLYDSEYIRPILRHVNQNFRRIIQSVPVRNLLLEEIMRNPNFSHPLHPPKPFYMSFIWSAVKDGDIVSIKWLRSQNPPCPWDHFACADAVAGGYFDILKWLRAQDPPCPWDHFACAMFGPILGTWS